MSTYRRALFLAVRHAWAADGAGAKSGPLDELVAGRSSWKAVRGAIGVAAPAANFGSGTGPAASEEPDRTGAGAAKSGRAAGIGEVATTPGDTGAA